MKILYVLVGICLGIQGGHAQQSKRSQQSLPGVLITQVQLGQLDSLDTGEYSAIIKADSIDRQKVAGICHIYRVHSSRVTTRQHPRALTALVEAANEYTNIRMDVAGLEGLSSRTLQKMPWVFLGQVDSEFTGSELRNLGRYLASGGFVFADAGQSIGSEADTFMRLNIKNALAKAGKRVRFKRLRPSHPIFSAYFKFDQPPPVPLQNTGTGRDNVDYLVGVEIGGRLVAILSYQAFGAAWENATNAFDNTRHLHFGINTIVYALLRE